MEHNYGTVSPSTFWENDSSIFDELSTCRSFDHSPATQSSSDFTSDQHEPRLSDDSTVVANLPGDSARDNPLLATDYLFEMDEVTILIGIFGIITYIMAIITYGHLHNFVTIEHAFQTVLCGGTALLLLILCSFARAYYNDTVFWTPRVNLGTNVAVVTILASALLNVLIPSLWTLLSFLVLSLWTPRS